MEISGAASGQAAQAAKAPANPQDVGTAVLKKVLDTQEQTAENLLSMLPKPANPSHLGNNIDVHA